MIEMSLAEVASVTAGRRLAPPPGADVEVTAVSTDSRQVAAGTLFGAVRGARADGHDYLEEVLDAGAAGALVAADWPGTAQAGALLQQRPDLAARLVAVGDVVTALADLARASLARLREAGELRVVALTGSVGKTTTKDLLAGVLRGDLPAQDPQVISPPGSFNNELGLPLTVLRATRATRVLVLEMGADHVGNIAHLTAVAPPDVALVLAVGRAHLGEFGGIDAVARAKSEMVTGALPGATVVLNADDPRVRAMADLAATGPGGAALPEPRRVVTFSAAGDRGAHVVARAGTVDETGHARFELRIGATDAGEVTLGLVGAHHVANALAAAAAADALGVAPGLIAARLSGLSAASPHRMAVGERADGVVVIDDAYNANPDSMRAALASLVGLGRRRGRTVAVLGEMLELGEDSAAEHRGVGAEAARLGVDVLVEVRECGIGAGAREALSQQGASAIEMHATADTQEAARLLARVVRPGDTVLFKGSNGSGLWRLAEDFLADTPAEGDAA